MNKVFSFAACYVQARNDSFRYCSRVDYSTNAIKTITIARLEEATKKGEQKSEDTQRKRKKVCKSFTEN